MPSFPRIRGAGVENTRAPQKRCKGKSFLQCVSAAKNSIGIHNFTISNTIVDSTGTPVVGATVKLFRTGNDCFIAKTTTDGSGTYSFTISDNAGNFYVIAYLAGVPDTFGTSANTLTLV